MDCKSPQSHMICVESTDQNLQGSRPAARKSSCICMALLFVLLFLSKYQTKHHENTALGPMVPRVRFRLHCCVPIQGHTAVVIGTEVMVFGGIVNGERGNEVNVDMVNSTKTHQPELVPPKTSCRNRCTLPGACSSASVLPVISQTRGEYEAHSE